MDNKETYTAPLAQVILMAQEGVVCASTGTDGTPNYYPFNDEQTW